MVETEQRPSTETLTPTLQEEFNAATNELQASVEAAWTFYDSGRNELKKIDTLKKRLTDLRKEMLKAAMEGYAICSHLGDHAQNKRLFDKLKLSEKLGIFPKTEMKLVYGVRIEKSRSSLHVEEKPFLRLLCPDCTAITVRSVYTRDVDEVIQQEDGSLVLADSGRDITRLIEKIKKNPADSSKDYRHFMPNGFEGVTEEILQFFHIPAVPETPWRHNFERGEKS